MCYTMAAGAHANVLPNGVDCSTFAPRLQFIYTNVTEAFYATLESALVVSALCILPFLWYQWLCFLMPGLYAREGGAYSRVVLYAAAYLATVTAAVMFTVLPACLRFLVLFSVGDSLLQIHLEARIAPYLSWVFTTLLYCVCASLLPPLLYLCLTQGWLSAQGLIKNRKITSYFLLVTASLVSPADLMSQLACTGGLFVLLECVIWLAIYKGALLLEKAPVRHREGSGGDE